MKATIREDNRKSYEWKRLVFIIYIKDGKQYIYNK